MAVAVAENCVSTQPDIVSDDTVTAIVADGVVDHGCAALPDDDRGSLIVADDVPLDMPSRLAGNALEIRPDDVVPDGRMTILFAGLRSDVQIDVTYAVAPVGDKPHVLDTKSGAGKEDAILCEVPNGSVHHCEVLERHNFGAADTVYRRR